MRPIEVPANPWIDTGLEVKAGDILTVRYISGLWSLGPPEPLTDGEGIPNSKSPRTTVDTDESVLCGYIGTNNPQTFRCSNCFRIGNGLTFTALNDGNLWLGMNDWIDGYYNNYGSITVGIPGPVCQYILTGMKIVTPLGELTLISTNRFFPYSVLVNLAGAEYTVYEGIPLPITGGILSTNSITLLGANVCLEIPDSLNFPPPIVPPYEPPAEPPVVPPGTVLPPPPVLDACVLPELSWNFIEVVRQAVLYISCNLGNLITQVSWLVSVLAALIPQLLAGITYFLSLKWITDWIQAFFERLDIWISAKFGIDPALPFWEELVKKALAWIGSFLDAAAEERMRIRGWK